jgi:hypothetical protein
MVATAGKRFLSLRLIAQPAPARSFLRQQSITFVAADLAAMTIIIARQRMCFSPVRGVYGEPVALYPMPEVR